MQSGRYMTKEVQLQNNLLPDIAGLSATFFNLKHPSLVFSVLEQNCSKLKCAFRLDNVCLGFINCSCPFVFSWRNTTKMLLLKSYIFVTVTLLIKTQTAYRIHPLHCTARLISLLWVVLFS